MGILPQPFLISGTNIKTINGNSILGSGNLSVSGGSSYEHTQSSPSATWTVNHNLGRYPNSVKVMSTGRVQLLAQVTDVNINQTVINFASAQVGTVQIN